MLGRALYIGLIFLGAAVAPSSVRATDDVIYGEMILTHGFVERDGVKVPVAGTRIPYVAERIQAKRVGEPDFPWLTNPGNGNGLPAEATAYLRDNGDGSYYINGYPCPSALDDITMAAQGQNQPWKKLTMGIHSEAGVKFLIRWQVYDTYQGGLGGNVSAWYPWPLPGTHDFGGYVNNIGAGTWKVTFDISIMGCRVADGQFGLGVQFRTQQANGEGPFIDSLSMVFCGGNSSMGTTEPIFWFDDDPRNGVYTEFEVEQFDPANASSFLLGITVGGTVHTVQPDTYQITAGDYVSGNLSALKFSNDVYLVIRVTNRQRIAQLVVESDAPSNQPIGYTFRCEAASNRPGLNQKIELYNYQQSRWDLFTVSKTTTSDVIYTASVGSDPKKYVDQATGRVKARVTWENLQNISDNTQVFQSGTSLIKVDLTDWQIVTP